MSVDLSGQEVLSVDRFFAWTLDPVHVGTGGYRLGRVDNAVVREPGTNLPKIPGSSISGVARAYAAYQTFENGRPKIQCAGQDADVSPARQEPGHCGRDRCPICLTFGYSKAVEEERGGKSRQGMAQFFDAQLLLFPVYSRRGPMWATSPWSLRALGDEAVNRALDNLALAPDAQEIYVAFGDELATLNLGWINLPVAEGDLEPLVTALQAALGLAREEGEEEEGEQESEATEEKGNDPISGVRQANEAIRRYRRDEDEPLRLRSVPASLVKEITARLVLVPDDLYGEVVNNNLEVRTSVAIDARRGAAVEGGLFTLEAIPRAALLWLEVALNDPRFFIDDANGLGLDDIRETVEKGFAYFPSLGIGGMGTRGFGRMEVWRQNG